MVTINLFHANTEEQDRITITNFKDLHDYIIVQKQCREFKLIFENGKRLSNLKISKIEQLLQKDFKDKKEIKVLLTTKQNSILKNLDDIVVKKDLANALEKLNINIENSEKIKLWHDIISQIRNDTKTLEIQKSIINILENFYMHTISNQENRLQKLNERKIKYLEENTVLEKQLETYLNNLEKESRHNLVLNDLIDNDSIRKQFPKFQKMCDNFNRKIDLILESNSLLNLKKKILEICKFPNDYNKTKNTRVMSLYEMLDEIKNKKDINEIRKIYLEIQKLDLNQFKQMKEECYRIKKNNSSKIKLLLTDKCMTLKTEISKIDELELIEKSLKKDVDIFLIPKILPEEIREMHNEVVKRKEYEYFCEYYRKYFMENVVNIEEERRKEFKEKKKILIKNALYKSIFENLVEKTEYEKNEEFIKKLPNLEGEINIYCEELTDKLKYQATLASYKDNKLFDDYYQKLTEINNDLSSYLRDKYKLIINHTISESGDKFSNILNNILESINKMKDTSVSISAPNFDISNLTINQSIYESQIKKDEDKNKYIDANAHEEKVTEGINNFISIHKAKIYFYDKFYDYLLGYASKFKINHNLNPENPGSIGVFVEKILTDHIMLLRERCKIFPKKKDK